jgi:phosphonate transport system ATP-binding protein
MRLILELCAERRLAAIVNIHDVALAQMFLPRIVGLRAGEVVYDGPAAGLTPEVLTRIYGEEDWSKTSASESEEEEPALPASAPRLTIAVAP